MGPEYTSINVRRTTKRTVSDKEPRGVVRCKLCGETFEHMGRQAHVALRVHMADVHKAKPAAKKGGGA